VKWAPDAIFERVRLFTLMFWLLLPDGRLYAHIQDNERRKRASQSQQQRPSRASLGGGDGEGVDSEGGFGRWYKSFRGAFNQKRTYRNAGTAVSGLGRLIAAVRRLLVVNEYIYYFTGSFQYGQNRMRTLQHGEKKGNEAALWMSPVGIPLGYQRFEHLR
jgi:hypothetical protein